MDPLWTPKTPDKSAMAAFMRDVNSKFNTQITDYHQLWEWSVENHEDFWNHWWNYVNPIASKQPKRTLINSDLFERSRWFPDAELNFAENLLRFRDSKKAIVFRDEDGNRSSLSYNELYIVAGLVAAEFKNLGIGRGDRVAAILPNIPEAVIAMLATTWLGAVWSSCSPDFGTDGILERFKQIEPKLLISCDGYKFKGKTYSILDKTDSVRNQLKCKTVMVNWLSIGKLSSTIDWKELTNTKALPPKFNQINLVKLRG